MEGDIERLKHYSEKANSKWNDQTKRRELGKANALYTSNNGSIDPGFLENKMIKHAFDAYPKVRTGKFTIMDSDQEEEEIIDYGLVDEDKVNEPVQAVDNPNIPFGEEKQLGFWFTYIDDISTAYAGGGTPISHSGNKSVVIYTAANADAAKYSSHANNLEHLQGVAQRLSLDNSKKYKLQFLCYRPDLGRGTTNVAANINHEEKIVVGIMS